MQVFYNEKPAILYCSAKIKYGKKLLNKLYRKTEDFKINQSLKEFNEVFNLDIQDIDKTKLGLSMKKYRQ